MMTPQTYHANLAAAEKELRHRLLDFYSNPIARLLYLASTRDIHTGEYFDDRLAMRYSPEICAEALLRVHREVFEELVFLSLQEILVNVSDYIYNTAGNSAQTLREWLTNKPYRMLRPKDYDPTAASVFFSQVTTALEIIAVRPAAPPAD
jgi:hypothetical protein